MVTFPFPVSLCRSVLRMRRTHSHTVHSSVQNFVAFPMRWFGFGFNAFGQIYVHEKPMQGECSDAAAEVKVSSPTELSSEVDRRDCCVKNECQKRASWSRRASLHLNSKSVTPTQTRITLNALVMTYRSPSIR